MLDIGLREKNRISYCEAVSIISRTYQKPEEFPTFIGAKLL